MAMAEKAALEKAGRDAKKALADQKATLEKLGREKSQMEKGLTAAMAD